MPIHEVCGRAFDRLPKMTDPDPDPENCRACATAAVKYQVAAASFRLAGGGYQADLGDNERNLADRRRPGSR